jgi:hypothetical protein
MPMFREAFLCLFHRQQERRLGVAREMLVLELVLELTNDLISLGGFHLFSDSNLQAGGHREVGGMDVRMHGPKKNSSVGRSWVHCILSRSFT